jgi:positive regulator of sigma E activity
MSENRVLKISFIIVFASLLTLFLLKRFFIITYIELLSISLPAIFTTVNFVLAAVSIDKSYKKPHKNVFDNFLKWMGVRMLLLVFFVIISLKFLEINQNSLIFSTLIFYVYYLAIEIIFIIIKEF